MVEIARLSAMRDQNAGGIADVVRRGVVGGILLMRGGVGRSAFLVA
jgi:hypothetical protein